jgi:hypothetical protein
MKFSEIGSNFMKLMKHLSEIILPKESFNYVVFFFC